MPSVMQDTLSHPPLKVVAVAVAVAVAAATTTATTLSLIAAVVGEMPLQH